MAITGKWSETPSIETASNLFGLEESIKALKVMKKPNLQCDLNIAQMGEKIMRAGV